MRYGINPANIHEFSKDVVTYFNDGNFDVINELTRVSETLHNFCDHSPDAIDTVANTLDDVILNVLVEQYTTIKNKLDEKPKQTKEVKK